ncbi:Chymotrypsin B [Dissostichus eleginoides]|uniref:Chymotrypsin B n=1 Tax=Dissostichus eleginoides TaxID=100907 RepID=A0AAD9B3C0_DISEL|nr:Chymotrypsin B [Dissostichus eleginoides]KAK1874859.1 Chymotrypsin B [Dissostichus eleginoides]
MAFLWIVSCLAFISAAYGCGTPAITPQVSGYARIVNGEEAVPHSWPWTYHVVIVGEHNKGSGSNEDIQKLKPAQVFTHPLWNPRTISNDISLIKLASPARLGPNVSPVCLAESSDNFSAGTTCVTSGWGLTRYNAANTPNLLQQASLPLLSNEQCKQHWGSNISGVMICAGGAGATSCMVRPRPLRVSPSLCLSPFYARVTELRSWVDQTLAAN